ncbi:MAG: carbon monoxide dehydrogenase subunit [Geminicoccaceae bacterium]|jgi:carbon monoxide dehydrogenase subunit G|nr:carbon monoxide dehydrogenase subunit [Solirubrobacterales bacterium]MCE3246274.1 carbon monoxide dehydrogenase subunit [Geminicoccaceae bacterium]
MQFDNSFSVPKPIDEVWATMLDLERVIPCVPDARVLEKTDDKSVKAEIKIRLGSMSMDYSGPAEIVERDDDAHRAVLSANAREARGQGNARAKVEIRLADAGGSTDATIRSDVTVTGRAAAMGEGVISGVTEGMINEFAENLGKL